MRKKKRRKGKKIAALLIVAVIILLAAGVLFLTMRQVNQLNDETAKIVRMDIDEDVIDEEIYTNGSYAEIEQTIKDYMSDYIENLKTVRTLFQDQEFSDLLSVENIEADGPEFKNSAEYLSEKRRTADEAFQKLEEMAGEEMIMAAIEKKGLSSYFEQLYRKLALENLRVNFMYSAEAVSYTHLADSSRYLFRLASSSVRSSFSFAKVRSVCCIQATACSRDIDFPVCRFCSGRSSV